MAVLLMPHSSASDAALPPRKLAGLPGRECVRALQQQRHQHGEEQPQDDGEQQIQRKGVVTGRVDEDRGQGQHKTSRCQRAAKRARRSASKAELRRFTGGTADKAREQKYHRKAGTEIHPGPGRAERQQKKQIPQLFFHQKSPLFFLHLS